MRILLVGYGTMGHEVEKLLPRRGHTVAARVDPLDGAAEYRSLDGVPAADVDMAIEFSAPGAARGNIEALARLGISAVVGTTGWYGELPEVRKRVQESGIGLLYGSNFSIGAHLFFALAASAARMVNALPEYDLAVLEMHHRHKKDSPSGTALATAKTILANCTRKKRIVTERMDRSIAEEELHVASLRGGEFPGKHSVFLDSAADTVEISHAARSRGGFALGAVLAAEWLAGKKGCFEVSEFMKELLAE